MSNNPEPGGEGPWNLVKVPQVKPGDAVISASSGRILQNKEGTVTEVPNGLRVPWFPQASAGKAKSTKEIEEALSMLASIINEVRNTVFAFNMVEAKEEVDPEAHFHVRTGEHLDALHGPGTATAFADRMDLSTAFPGTKAAVAERIHPEGSTVVETVWTNQGKRVAGLRLHLDAERAHYDKLEVEPEYRGQGFYQALIRRPSWWRTLGVKIITAEPEDAHAQRVLALGGFHWQEFNGQSYFGVRLDQRDRMDDYREWLETGSNPKQEPEWHQELRQQAKLL
jgi:GNAT superfamily N-acetyltransferase